eukprot:7082165-Heterocapsa_arctica.AAC.1
MHPSGCVRDAGVDDAASRGCASQELVQDRLAAGAAGFRGLRFWQGQLPGCGCCGRCLARSCGRVSWGGGIVRTSAGSGWICVEAPPFPRVGEAGR